MAGKPWTLKLLGAVRLALKGGVELEELADLTGRPFEEVERAATLLLDHQPAAALAKLNKAPVSAPTAAPALRSPDGIVVPPPPFLSSCSPSRGRAIPARPRAVAPPPPPATRPLKPVTGRVAAWTAKFLAAGWDLEEVAGLFDRDPEALGRAAEAFA